MNGPSSPIIPPEIASHVLEGVETCDGMEFLGISSYVMDVMICIQSYGELVLVLLLMSSRSYGATE
ncbi:hypothetical protein C5167_041570 [Papaver somniferum]|nr:hypothetical protein C5167_041570 [Papaver somniferum]